LSAKPATVRPFTTDDVVWTEDDQAYRPLNRQITASTYCSGVTIKNREEQFLLAICIFMSYVADFGRGDE
jgi:hypothetical protein